MRYPQAEWVPWQYGPLPTYYKGQNRPEAVVLHVMQGYATTARSWASSGHFGASWHFTVGRDGHVMQHLDFQDGGYHAGIPSTKPNPVWNLWKGHGVNVNHYTIGVEHEGFTGEPFADAQMAASRDLCRWLSTELAIPLDYDHFPPHAAIDLIDRPNDFNVPVLRDAYYGYLFEEDDMTPEQLLRLERLELALFSGSEEGSEARDDRLRFAQFRAALRDTPGDTSGWQPSLAEQVAAHTINHPGAATVAPHAHKTTVTTATTGEVIT